ncbi:MAG: ATP-binding protein [Nitrospirae bacterium]|nr:ATP-binding protein [Nitrospirota bacterium]MCL5977779.1 ATP-binding protein [Nitrospirota bacterium]
MNEDLKSAVQNIKPLQLIARLFTKEKRIIKLLVVITTAMTVVLPLFNIFVMMPEFNRVLTEQIENEAVSIAAHLRTIYFSRVTGLNGDSLPSGVKSEALRFKKDFRLMKVKVFSASGEVIYSSDPEDIGKINEERYFQESVAKGNPYKKVINKGDKTLEGQIAAADVVETYVPITAEGVFLGAFEIYKDITAEKGRLTKVIAGSSVCLSLAGLVFLAAVGIISYKARNAINTREQAEREVAEANERLEQRVIERTAELYKEVSARREVEKGLLESEGRYKKLSEEFNALLDAIPDTLLLLSSDLKVTWANKGAARSLGKEVSDLIERHCHELWFERSMPCADCYAIKSFKTGNVEASEVITPDGRIWDVSAFPLKEDDGTVKNVIIVSRDITEKRRIEEEMIKTDKLDSLGMLAGGIAHDFNNMLAAISLKIAAARIYADPEDKVFKKLNEAEHIIFTAKFLPQQLLTFAKGGLPIKESIFVRDLIDTSINLVMSGSDAGCEISLPDDLRPVEADEGQIIQVLTNLLINANHAMPDGGTVRIFAENIDIKPEASIPLKNGRYVKLSIQDSGVGIPEDHLQKIFDPFFTTKRGGCGLGLAVAYSIVKKHNGHIALESEVGSGTTFHVYLPASEKAVVMPKGGGTVYGGRGNILVMDDDKNILEFTGDILRHLGYSVELARDGGEMIEIYESAMRAGQPFDAVVIDLTVAGGMGGKEAIQELMRLDPSVKAIVVSAYFNDPVLADFRQYGFCGAFVKPYKVEDLNKELRNIIEGREKKNE